MKEYRVSLHEEPGDKFRIVFDCMAEDTEHAAEQAEDAYPGCEILTVYEKGSTEDLGERLKARGYDLEELEQDNPYNGGSVMDHMDALTMLETAAQLLEQFEHLINETMSGDHPDAEDVKNWLDAYEAAK